MTTPDHFHRIRVGRSIDGFGLSPGITKEQRLEVEGLMKKAFVKMTGDLAGLSYPLEVRNTNLSLIHIFAPLILVTCSEW